MVDFNYLKAKLDQIEETINQLSWIDSYEIFIQNIESLLMKRFEFDIMKNDERTRAGASLRLISKNQRLIKHSFSLSSIPNIDEIRSPKSTMAKIPITQFPKLSKPRSENIPGDKSSSTELDRDGKTKILGNIDNVVSIYKIPFFDSIYVEKEQRIIKNQGSIQLQSQTLKLTYQISTKFKLGDTEYILSRSVGSRSIDPNYSEIVDNLVDSVDTRVKLQRCHVEPTMPVIFHPNIFGKLMANYFYNHNITKLSKLTNWNSKLHIYDDPLREAGFNSCLFDDEGSLTRSKPIIIEGEIVDDISDFQSSNWTKGGNGYRVDWFEPFTRSYKYPIKPSITNLIIGGGTGRGEYFTERSGQVILIREGYSYLKSSITNISFILHANETEIWENGILKGPADNITIQGTLDNVISNGRLSADEREVIDPHIPGTVYTGWIALGPEEVKIR